jgi:hypothetical protein
VGRRAGSRVRVGMHEVVVGALFVEAMDLSAVVRFEEMKEFVEEVVHLDDGLSGDRRYRDFDRTRIGSHGNLGDGSAARGRTVRGRNRALREDIEVERLVELRQVTLGAATRSSAASVWHARWRDGSGCDR